MSIITNGLMGGLQGVGRAATSAATAVASAPLSAGRRALSSVGLMSAPAAGAAPGLASRGLNYGARHVMSGTLPGSLVMGMTGTVPLSRYAADGAGMVRAGKEQMSAAREGHGVMDPNALSEVQMRRMGLKQAADATRAGAASNVMLSHEQVVDAVKQGGTEGLAKQAFMAEAIGGTLAATAIGAGANLVRDAWRAHKADKVFAQLKGFNTKQDRANLEVIKMYSPMLAQNPTVLESELRRLRQMDLVPHELVGSYTSMQGDRDKQDLGEAGFRTGLSVVAPTVAQGIATERARADRERAQAEEQRLRQEKIRERDDMVRYQSKSPRMPERMPERDLGGNVGEKPRDYGMSRVPSKGLGGGLASTAGAVRATAGGVSPAISASIDRGRPDARRKDDDERDKKAELDPSLAPLASELAGIDSLFGR